MFYPKFYNVKRDTLMQKGFGGYNRSHSAADGEFFHMHNMGSAAYPALSPRRARGKNLWEKTAYPILGAFSAHDADKELLAVLCHMTDSRDMLVVYDAETELVLYNTYIYSCVGQKRQFVNFGSSTVMFPDKLFLQLTASKCVTRSLENTTTVKSTVPDDFGDVGYIMVEQKQGGGWGYIDADDSTWSSPEPPDSASAGTWWLDTSRRADDPYGSHVGVVRCYSPAQRQFAEVYPTYVMLRYPGIGSGFSAGDRVELTLPSNVGPLLALSREKTIVDCGHNFVVVEGIVEYPEVNAGYINPFHVGITLTRRVPDMDYVISCGNRLWGCRSGADGDSYVNEVYATALGDVFNWRRFDGVSSDSYAVSIGEAGPFTGAAVTGGTPVFFKENCAVKIYGSLPSNFETVTVPLDGIERGCDASAVNINGALFYKAVDGIAVYDGSYPRIISRKLGDVRYGDAVAGCISGRYYVSLADADGARHLFVYDSSVGTWHREDGADVICFCRCDRRLYMVCAREVRAVESETADDVDLNWSCITGMLGTSSPDGKSYTDLRLRADIPAGSFVDVSVEYDSSGIFEYCARFTATGTGTCKVPIMPAGCDHMRLRLSGMGQVKIYSLALDREDM